MKWLFGLAALVLGLAVAASIPIVQFLSLGYLLEASGESPARGDFRPGSSAFARLPGQGVSCSANGCGCGRFALLIAGHERI